jgi:hypothetical protein
MDRWMDSLPWMKTERADTSRHSDTVISIWLGQQKTEQLVFCAKSSFWNSRPSGKAPLQTLWLGFVVSLL